VGQLSCRYVVMGSFEVVVGIFSAARLNGGPGL
jgi:hypothetical protein